MYYRVSYEQSCLYLKTQLYVLTISASVIESPQLTCFIVLMKFDLHQILMITDTFRCKRVLVINASISINGLLVEINL